MKNYFLFLIFIFFFCGCSTLGYESIKGARPYDVVVQSTPEHFQETARGVLTDFGYHIKEEKKVYLLAVSDKKDAHVYMEWFKINENQIRASIWRVKFKMHALSLDSQLGHDYEKLAPDSEIRRIGKKIKDSFL